MRDVLRWVLHWLSSFTVFVPPSPERTITVEAENRIATVEAESRVIEVSESL